MYIVFDLQGENFPDVATISLEEHVRALPEHRASLQGSVPHFLRANMYDEEYCSWPSASYFPAVVDASTVMKLTPAILVTGVLGKATGSMICVRQQLSHIIT